jgi:hypothetical protein
MRDYLLVLFVQRTELISNLRDGRISNLRTRANNDASIVKASYPKQGSLGAA